MIVKCPVCEAEYDCTKGKYQCKCGAKFYVSETGETCVVHLAASQSSAKLNERTMQFDGGDVTDTRTNEKIDPDKTIPPRRHEEYDASADVTIPGARARKPDGRFSPGDVIMGRYKVLAELGQGGMGVVYKCFDETGGIEVALKALPPELSHNTIEMEDIRDNFQLVAKLVHQNIAISKNLERDNSNGNYYLIMECVEGEDLRRWIRRKRQEGKLTLDDVLPVVRQIAAALDYAHEEGVIHRDIKPGNIMIDQQGHVKVLDFGLAAQIHTSMTRVSMAYQGTSGTGPYMAPEQWRGRAQGAAADQYALAVMTYEMLAGHLPFESTDAAVLREAVLNDTPEPIPGIPGAVQQALARALSKEPAERFASCADLVSALTGGKPSAPGCGRSGVPQRRWRAWGAVVLIALVALIAVIAVIAVSGENGSGSGGSSSEHSRGSSFAEEPMKKLSNMELYELQRKLEQHKPALVKLDREQGFGAHIDDFVKYLQIGSDALSHNDFGTASDGLQRAEREAKWLTVNEARRAEERRKAEEARRKEEERRAEERRKEEARRFEEFCRQFRVAKLSTGNYMLHMPNDVKLELVKIEAGTFTMGERDGENDSDEKEHRVTLTRDFYLGKTEVTQAQWKAVMGNNPSYFKGDDLPVEKVSWNDAMEFCKKLNEMGKAPSGWKFTLPTEAQWEYAARGGRNSRGYKYSGSDNPDEVAWYNRNSGNEAHPVARKKANELGLFDMSGNVWEWCLDDWNDDSSKARPEFTRSNYRSGSDRVNRGGGWGNRASGCRSASRSYDAPGNRLSGLGFRLALVQVR